MATTQEKIQLLEKDANNLVTNLKELYTQIGKYKEAKDALNKVSNSLQSFINETKILSQEAHSIITRLNEIGASNILDGISNIKQNQHKIFKQIQDNNENAKKGKKSILVFMLTGFSFAILLQLIIILKLFLII